MFNSYHILLRGFVKLNKILYLYLNISVPFIEPLLSRCLVGIKCSHQQFEGNVFLNLYLTKGFSINEIFRGQICWHGVQELDNNKLLQS